MTNTNDRLTHALSIAILFASTLGIAWMLRRGGDFDYTDSILTVILWLVCAGRVSAVRA